MDENPFPDTQIKDWSFLDVPGPRNQCPKCKRSRKYYCYTCYVPLPHIGSELPKVKLPLKVDIIKHPSEIDGKSTCSHAAILAPDDVVVHTYPCIPDYDREKVVLVFPCEQSVTLEDLAAAYSYPQEQNITNSKRSTEDSDAVSTALGDTEKINSSESCINGTDNLTQHVSESSSTESNNQIREKEMGCIPDKVNQSSQECRKRTYAEMSGAGDIELIEEFPSKKPNASCPTPFERVVFIDSTWNQTRNIVNDERLKDLKRVELQSRNTNFWRCQEGIPRTYLSTIEAIYFFMKDFHTLFIDTEYKHEYDNLLFFFCFMYNKIRKSAHGGENLKAYQR